MPISAWAAWPGGWVQNLNFFVFGFLMIGFAIGLHRGMHPGRGDVAGPGLLVLSGIGLLSAGAFPWRVVEGAFIVPAGHLLGAALTFLGAGMGLTAISRRMSGDPRWQGLATYALTSGIAILVLFLLVIGLARTEDAPLRPWLGLLQRLILAVWFACMIVLALRLWRVADTDR